LKEAAAAAAAVIVGSVGLHVDEIFFTHNRLGHVAQIFRDRISIALSDDLAWVLDCEFDFQILVPVRVYLKLSLTNPFGIVLINVLNFKIMLEVEFFQSGPD